MRRSGTGGPPPATGRFVYGVGPVRELLRVRPKAVQMLYVDGRRAQSSGDDPVVDLTRAALAWGLAIDPRTSAELDELVGPDARHQGVVARVGEFAYAQPEDLIAAAARSGQQPILVALDGIEDPRNLGAIVRSAYLLGAHGVIIPTHRAAPVTPVVTKVSAGATELLPIAQVNNLARTLEDLKSQGIWNVAVHVDQRARPLHMIDLNMPLCLVLGAEDKGIRSLVAKQCDFHAIIPMASEGVGSFNASVAAALVMYEARRQRLTQTV